MTALLPHSIFITINLMTLVLLHHTKIAMH